MKKMTLVLGAAWICGALQACGSTERSDHGEQPEGPEFSSSVPEDKTLESLSETEAETVCRDLEEFISQDVVQQDNCRMLGVLAAAFTAEFSAEASDADLRSLCSTTYEECASSAAATDGECDASEFSDNCSASVAEYGACLEETFGQLHGFVGQLPSCSSLSRETLSEMSPEGPPFGVGAECANFQAKCPGISQAAEDFVADYCARIDPCCSDAKLGDQCRALTAQKAQAMHFDAAAAAVCLARLEEYSDDAAFCSGIAQTSYYTDWSAAIPECEAVFSGGSDSSGQGAPLGGACEWDEDCAAPEVGVVRCVPSTSIFDRVCAPVTRGKVGDPCLATVAEINGTLTEWAGEATAAGGAFCHFADNLHCDEQTLTCAGAKDLGEECTSTLECSSNAYCSPERVCAERLAEGDRCDNYFGECAGAGDCDDTSLTCTLPLPAGAPCSESGGTTCASGICSDGACTHPLAPLCGER